MELDGHRYFENGFPKCLHNLKKLRGSDAKLSVISFFLDQSHKLSAVYVFSEDIEVGLDNADFCMFETIGTFSFPWTQYPKGMTIIL